jgi:hypothetical protein
VIATDTPTFYFESNFTNIILQTVYSGITYAGYVGLVTGQRPNVFTITMDERGR